MYLLLYIIIHQNKTLYFKTSKDPPVNNMSNCDEQGRLEKMFEIQDDAIPQMQFP